MADGLLFLVMMGVVLFPILAFVALALDRFAHFLFRLLMPDAKLADSPPNTRRAPTVKELRNDPQLLAFFKKSDPNFAREFPSLAGNPPPLPPDTTYAPPVAPKHALHTAAPELILNPTAVISEVEITSPYQPVVIRERMDPPLISEAPEPQPVSIRPDPAVIGGPPAPTLETPARPSPQPARAATDADLEALAALWMRLAPRDRHELLQLARLKLGLPTEPGRAV